MLFKMIIAGAVVTASLFGYSDTDLDGVSDTKDLCPNTSMELIVDQNGCPERKTVTLMLGYQLSEGMYGGTQKITNRSTSLFAAYNSGMWSYSLATSHEKTSNSITTSGPGDLYASLQYRGLGSQERELSLQATAKVATADTDIGTGENDYMLKLSTIFLQKKVSYLTSVGYTVTGDTASQTYEDVVSLSVGIGYQQSDRLYLSGSLNYATAYIQGADDALSALAFASYTLQKERFITLSYTVGLSDAVADKSVGVSYGINF